ncbi:manganese efflux pump [Alicyclobacillus cycloheptanicus]|jgi:putative Mn2+ efflux pump MntP|uniref:Mn2+ efflux pump MntP n=1 Tax=Alicyclobacillus cycloheptanicus TaxID=1457 RepID=A0ABT9XG23_9BACL|nr:manganese efflux pump [Alicyclobacillus cycloheptanicus]MDQ0189225.1 putative Mn2+ efflux pump MntP [Alicyclobacillus cycloheptanicus]WDM00409.1 manganese efflux pump [Alicyclobacillus cycloheptanicus]
MSWQLVLLALALGFNNAIAAVALGSGGMSRRHQLRTALLFAVFEALMPVIGVIIGEGAAAFLGRGAKYLGVAVLVGVGLYSLFHRDKAADDAAPAPPAHAFGVKLVLMSIALSLDNLTVGFGLGMLHVSVGMSAVVFGLVSLVMTFAGLELGRLIGRAVNISSDRLTGVVLLATAGIMLLQ